MRHSISLKPRQFVLCWTPSPRRWLMGILYKHLSHASALCDNANMLMCNVRLPCSWSYFSIFTYYHLLIYSNKVQLRLMGTSVVLQVFGLKSNYYYYYWKLMMMAPESKDHQSQYNSSWGKRECLFQIPWQSIQ